MWARGEPKSLDTKRCVRVGPRTKTLAKEGQLQKGVSELVQGQKL